MARKKVRKKYRNEPGFVSQMKRHILLCGNSSHSMFGFRAAVIQHLLQAGHRVTVLAPEDETTPDLIALGCEYYNYNLQRRGASILSDLATLRELYVLIKRLQPELCFFYTIKCNIYGNIAARLLKIPAVAITTGLGYVFLNDNFIARLARQLYKMSFRFPRQVWFLNRDDRDIFITKKLALPERCEILPGEGIDLDFYKPDFDGRKRRKKYDFIFIARMLIDKGVHELIEALQYLRTKSGTLPNVLFVGPYADGQTAGISHEQLLAWQSAGLIEYAGNSNDVRPLFAESRCVILPSYREGVPRVLLEGAAMRLPLLATDVPGCREVVQDGVNGFLCKAQDAKDLAEKMQKFMKLKAREVQKMGRCGNQIVAQNFAIPKVLDCYDRAIQDILTGHR